MDRHHEFSSYLKIKCHHQLLIMVSVRYGKFMDYYLRVAASANLHGPLPLFLVIFDNPQLVSDCMISR